MKQRTAGQRPLSISDEELVLKAREGDCEAFDELVTRHQERVYVLACRTLGNAEDAADVQQETFIRAWRSLRKFRRESTFVTWLHRITVNLCLTRKRRDRTVREMTLDERGWECAQAQSASRAEGPELSIAVRDLLFSLPPHHRVLLVLREVEGRSVEEIAAIRQVSLETARKQLYRARKLFRERLRSALEEEE